jgi:hypothetical protein
VTQAAFDSMDMCAIKVYYIIIIITPQLIRSQHFAAGIFDSLKTLCSLSFPRVSSSSS